MFRERYVHSARPSGNAATQIGESAFLLVCLRPHEGKADERGVTSGLLNLSRNLGLITGASLMGAIFTLAVGTKDVTLANAPAVATGMHVTFAVATALLLIALAFGFRRKT